MMKSVLPEKNNPVMGSGPMWEVWGQVFHRALGCDFQDHDSMAQTPWLSSFPK